VEQIQPASTCVARTALPQPGGGSMHTWYWLAGSGICASSAELHAFCFNPPVSPNVMLK
jgi:hypothetical protein